MNMKANPNRTKIIEAHLVPGGNISRDIFKLPCVDGASKLPNGDTMYYCVNSYHHDHDWAEKNDYICKDEYGNWFTLSSEEYHEYMSDE